jgi:3-methylfumaryl-CoA hydratase
MVRHEVRCNGSSEPAIVEFHDIVYRDAKRPGDVEPPPQRAETGAAWQREIVPDDVLLFRYSALTFNGHRIHYDRRYVTAVEGYPGLIVHGPLIATLLLDLLRRNAPTRRWRRSGSGRCARRSTCTRSGSTASRAATEACISGPRTARAS